MFLPTITSAYFVKFRQEKTAMDTICLAGDEVMVKISIYYLSVCVGNESYK